MKNKLEESIQIHMKSFRENTIIYDVTKSKTVKKTIKSLALFGGSWLDEPVDDDSPLFGRGFLDETHFEYFKNEAGDMTKITTKRELSDAIEQGNRYSFDGEDYTHLT